uniref:Putative secreted peptide n=1 Tax=Anopheles braziliensis TaxID=58242 RepID=A0A2M3ZNH3_9DIPT
MSNKYVLGLVVVLGLMPSRETIVYSAASDNDNTGRIEEAADAEASSGSGTLLNAVDTGVPIAVDRGDALDERMEKYRLLLSSSGFLLADNNLSKSISFSSFRSCSSCFGKLIILRHTQHSQVVQI